MDEFFWRRLRRSVCRVGVVVPVVVVAVSMTTAGCTKPLLTPEEDRSQYDHYDAIRSQRAPAYTEDEFGRRRPNVRGRLLDKQ